MRRTDTQPIDIRRIGTRRIAGTLFHLLLLLLLAGCQRDAGTAAYSGSAAPESAPMAAADAAGARGNRAESQAMLAYEHSVEIALPEDDIVARMQEAQLACRQAKFGDCVVLNVRQQGGDYPSASVGMRIAPAGVEPMIALASREAELGSRNTHAEDLAVVVRDNALAQDRLRRERERLQEFQARRDLAVADMIALSKQLAETEAQLQAAEQEGAQHRRRIDTQLLTLNFQPPRGERGRGEIGEAVRDFGRTLAMGTAWTIRALAFLIPLAVLLFVVVAGIRRWRRRS